MEREKSINTEEIILENLISYYEYAENDFKQAIEAFEEFKRENPLYKQAFIKHTCYCDRIRSKASLAVMQLLHPHEYEEGNWYDWLSFLKTKCSKYSFEIGTLIDMKDKQLDDDLEQEIIQELNTLTNQLEPLIKNTLKRIYSIGLKKAELSVEPTKEILDKKAYHEQRVEQTYNNLLAVQQDISDRLLGYLQFNALPVGKRDNIPSNTGGVYLLWKHGKLDYIGQSSAMRERLSGHHIFDKKTHLITAIPIEKKQERNETEIWLIKKLNPIRNIAYNQYPLNQTIDRL